MDLHNYLAYLVISLLTITSPGAAILLAINNAMRYDLKAVFFSTIGNVLGLFLLSLVAMFGVGVLIKSSDWFFLILKIVGALYLIYLGFWHALTGHKHFQLSTEGISSNYSAKKIFTNGFLVAATNPKPILFFTAIFPLFKRSLNGVAVFYNDGDVYGYLFCIFDDIRIRLKKGQSVVL